MPVATITGAKPIAQASPGVVIEADYALVTWALTTADPIGTAVAYPDYADRTVQFASSSWGAATAALEGSLDGGTTWFVLTDPQGNAISKTANAGEAVSEAVPLIRAQLTVVGAGAVVSAILYLRKGK